MKGCCQSYGRGVGASPSQGGVVVVFVHALEACDDDDSPVLQFVHNAVGVDAL